MPTMEPGKQENPRISWQIHTYFLNSHMSDKTVSNTVIPGKTTRIYSPFSWIQNSNSADFYDSGNPTGNVAVPKIGVIYGYEKFESYLPPAASHTPPATRHALLQRSAHRTPPILEGCLSFRLPIQFSCHF